MTDISMRIAVILPAAGSAVRFGGEVPKVLLPLCGCTVLEHSLRLFARCEQVCSIVVAVREQDVELVRRLCRPYAIVQVVAGGDSRGETVAAALAVLDKDKNITHVAVHDAARPLLHEEDLQALLERLVQEDAVTLATPPVDTVKLAADGYIQGSLQRDKLALVQTPQAFRLELLQQAYDHAAKNGLSATDDTALVEALGVTCALVYARHENLKLTYAHDLSHAELVLQQRDQACHKLPDKQEILPWRIGSGWDSHRLESGRKLILGGVQLDYEKGLAGHSDADVLVHAVIDALLGAAALPDIGRCFPDTDPAYAGISSMLLLDKVAVLLREQGFAVVNIDATVIAQAPKLAPHIDAMRQNLANALDCSLQQVSLKAKTAEKLGPVGEGLSMEAQAIALLCRK